MTFPTILDTAKEGVETLQNQGATIKRVEVSPDDFDIYIAEDPDDFDTSAVGGGVIKGNGNGGD